MANDTNQAQQRAQAEARARAQAEQRFNEQAKAKPKAAPSRANKFATGAKEALTKPRTTMGAVKGSAKLPFKAGGLPLAAGLIAYGERDKIAQDYEEAPGGVVPKALGAGTKFLGRRVGVDMDNPAQMQAFNEAGPVDKALITTGGLASNLWGGVKDVVGGVYDAFTGGPEPGEANAAGAGRGERPGGAGGGAAPQGDALELLARPNYGVATQDTVQRDEQVGPVRNTGDRTVTSSIPGVDGSLTAPKGAFAPQGQGTFSVMNTVDPRETLAKLREVTGGPRQAPRGGGGADNSQANKYLAQAADILKRLPSGRKGDRAKRESMLKQAGEFRAMAAASGNLPQQEQAPTTSPMPESAPLSNAGQRAQELAAQGIDPATALAVAYDAYQKQEDPLTGQSTSINPFQKPGDSLFTEENMAYTRKQNPGLSDEEIRNMVRGAGVGQ